MRRFGQRPALHVGVYLLIAVLIGVALALAGVRISGAKAALASDCRRYAPTLKDVNVNCYINNIMAGGDPSHWETPGVAVRISNSMATTADRQLYVEYVNSSISGSAVGTYVIIWDSNGVARKAACELNGEQVYGNCTTEYTQ